MLEVILKVFEACWSNLGHISPISHFHGGLILFQFDTIAPNLVPSVSNDLAH